MKTRMKTIFSGISGRNILSSVICLLIFSLPAGRIYGGELQIPRTISARYDTSLSFAIKREKDTFVDSIHKLRNEMYRHGIFSINSFADEVFKKTEDFSGDVRLDFTREALKVSPLNVKLWLYIALKDALSLHPFRSIGDILNLYYATFENPVSLLKSLYVFAAFINLFILSFALFFTISMVFKYLPSFTSDILRIKIIKRGEPYLRPVLLLLLLGLSIYLKSPYVFLMVMVILFSPYMVHREIIIAYLIIGSIILSIIFNGGLGKKYEIAVSPAGKNLLYLSYGIVDSRSPGKIELEGSSLIHQIGRARYQFLQGKYREALDLSMRLERNFGKEFGVFVSTAKFYGGDRMGALTKLEEIKDEIGPDPIVSFNLYQLYTSNFRFEEGARIIGKTWKDVKGKRPFSVNPATIEGNVLIPPTGGKEVLKSLFEYAEVEGVKSSPFSFLWDPPFGKALPFFMYLIVGTLVLRVVTYNRYITLSCRVCGDRQLWKVSLKKDDICQICRSKSLLVRGSSSNIEKLYPIRFRRKAIRVLSAIVPGYAFISTGAVTTFLIINLCFSFIISVFSLFWFFFPGEFSPLYHLIWGLGNRITGSILFLGYVGIGVGTEYFIRKIHRTHTLTSM